MGLFSEKRQRMGQRLALCLFYFQMVGRLGALAGGEGDEASGQDEA